MLSSWQEFTATGSSNTDTGKALGNLETKYKIKDYGLTFIQKWNTDNTLGTEVSMEDQVRETLYSENVSALGMRKYYWVEQKTLKHRTIWSTKKQKKLCCICSVQTERQHHECGGVGGTSILTAKCCYILIQKYRMTADAGVPDYLAEWISLFKHCFCLKIKSSYLVPSLLYS